VECCPFACSGRSRFQGGMLCTCICQLHPTGRSPELACTHGCVLLWIVLYCIHVSKAYQECLGCSMRLASDLAAP
jgi:hypothetical protein